MVAGDFNGDGKQDIATSFIPDTGGISVALGNGDGTFGTAIANPALDLLLQVYLTFVRLRRNSNSVRSNTFRHAGQT
jgi:hypothetical protein